MSLPAARQIPAQPEGRQASQVPTCGHVAVPHGDHTDYLVGGQLHHMHGDHCDNHGRLEVVGTA